MKKIVQFTAVLAMFALISCEKYLDNTPLPADKLEGSTIYTSDNTTAAVVTGVFSSINSNGAYAGSASANIGFTLSLYADETKSLVTGNYADVFYKNAIQPAQSSQWQNTYTKLFAVNIAIKGVVDNASTLELKDQWLGELYFLRAFLYYNLVAMYGPVPLAITVDYTINKQLSRSPESEVYAQIIADLKLAQSLLSTDYKDASGKTTTNKYRPNKATATALLARVYLYNKDWNNAEDEATKLIENPTYDLLPLNQVFLANSKETIWNLGNNSPKRANEYLWYNNGTPDHLSATQTPNATFAVHAALSDQLYTAFEATDGRLSNWVRTVTAAASATRPLTLYRFPFKYQSATNDTELQVLFRLSEQYLIRAEARAMKNLPTAAEDLNSVRNRAGLISIHPASDAMLTEILNERQRELFTEGGHRFYDLKRTGKLDEVMNLVAPTKGTVWQSYMANWPIPTNDILLNPNLTPNPGYQQ